MTDEPFTRDQVSIGGAPTVHFTFSGSLMHAVLKDDAHAMQIVGVTSNEADDYLDKPTEARLVFTAADGFVLADITVHARPARPEVGTGPMCLTENVMGIAASLMWSHWRYLQAKAREEADRANDDDRTAQ